MEHSLEVGGIIINFFVRNIGDEERVLGLIALEVCADFFANCRATAVGTDDVFGFPLSSVGSFDADTVGRGVNGDDLGLPMDINSNVLERVEHVLLGDNLWDAGKVGNVA